MEQMRKARTRETRLGRIAAIAAGCVLIGAAGAVADVSATPTSAKPAIARQLSPSEIQARAFEGRLFVAQQQQQQMAQGSLQVADLFGESDEEKAAREQHEQAQDASIARLNQRVQDLEDSLRRLTGQMEQMDHRMSDLNTRIERMQRDFDYKLCTMAAQQLGASGDQGGLPCSQASTQSPAPSQNLAPPPGVLGSLPSNTPIPLPPPVNAAPAPVPAASPNRPQFDAAMNLLAKAQYDQARAAFRSYADSYPKDDLTPQAVYWVGDIAYVQKDYPNAARAFAEEIKKYGSSPRAPDSMLKLGQSLIALNQTAEGCTTLGALQSKYPQASKTVLTQAATARKAARCK
jgi:tol-pal system protein YbgF